MSGSTSRLELRRIRPVADAARSRSDDRRRAARGALDVQRVGPARPRSAVRGQARGRSDRCERQGHDPPRRRSAGVDRARSVRRHVRRQQAAGPARAPHGRSAPRIEGAIDAESLEAPAIVAAAIGMPARRGADAAGWSTEPFVWSTPGLAGRIEFKSQRAMLLPGVAAQQLRGVARFNTAEIVFEDIAGEMAKGRFEGRLAVANGSDGMSARVRFALARRRSRRAVRGRGAAGHGRQARHADRA